MRVILKIAVIGILCIIVEISKEDTFNFNKKGSLFFKNAIICTKFKCNVKQI